LNYCYLGETGKYQRSLWVARASFQGVKLLDFVVAMRAEIGYYLIALWGGVEVRLVRF
jgi:hypothetical protein